jgi:hypothetical protein
MIERTFDAAWFNGICNLPEVRPGLGGEGEIDVSALILNPANYALKTEHGGFILIAHGAGVYSVHSQFSAEGRGKFAVRAMRAGLEYMFTRTDCMRIFSHCPDSNPATLGLARAGWAHQWFRREIEPQLGPGMTVSWDVFDWPNNDLSLEEDGRAFHALTEEALSKLGADLPEHPEDRVHDRYVGAAVRMCKRGWALKGVGLYNVYAVAAGYTPVQLINSDPVMVDCSEPGIVNMTMMLNAQGEMEVVQCQLV